ncbi:MAG: DUF4266 domain-containing protein [Myxococcales bacterium]|nr:DUF4266 domain-containing protein [Myxococcales bacterium]
MVPHNRRARLADPIMALDPDPLETHRKAKFYSTREGAAGGDGAAAGGGCGSRAHSGCLASSASSCGTPGRRVPTPPGSFGIAFTFQVFTTTRLPFTAQTSDIVVSASMTNSSNFSFGSPSGLPLVASQVQPLTRVTLNFSPTLAFGGTIGLRKFWSTFLRACSRWL